MSKKAIRKTSRMSIVGTLDVENMVIECSDEDSGVRSLQDEFESFDGKEVTITIEYKS